MTTTLTLSTDTHFILMREYSAIESMEICKIKCTIVRVKVKGFWLLNLQLKQFNLIYAVLKMGLEIWENTIVKKKFNLNEKLNCKEQKT